jgi:hypothetical protein
MTTARLTIRWIGIDAGNRAALAAVLGVVIPDEGSIEISGLRLEIVAPGPGRARGRLQVTEPAAGPTGPVPSTARFIALGWATVDLERAAATWPGVRWRTAPRDSLVGARALVGRTGTPAGAATADAITFVLLEPDTEGRLAASLARHGEGPAALYVLVPPDAIAAIAAHVARLGVRFLAGPGPFGPAWAIVGPDASSPTVIVVAGAAPDA